MKILRTALCLSCVFLVFQGCSKPNEPTKPKIENSIEDPIEKLIDDRYKKLLDLHNKIRNKNNSASLDIDLYLNSYAQKHAEFMAKNKRLIHSNISEIDAVDVGENIAYGQKNEKEVVDSWMNSSGHRKNIINTKFKKVGFGVFESKNKIKYWCSVFTD